MLRKHRIPVSEALLCYEPATRTGGRFDQDTDGAGGRPGGTLLIFSNTLVFQVGPESSCFRWDLITRACDACAGAGVRAGGQVSS